MYFQVVLFSISIIGNCAEVYQNKSLSRIKEGISMTMEPKSGLSMSES